jgi:hypothetical protein
MIKRRILLKSALFSLPAFALGWGSDSVQIALHKLSGAKNKILAQLFFKYHQDKADKDPAYLAEHDFTAWHKEIHPYLKQLPSLGVPSGAIVELGVHRGHSSKVLKRTFGAGRYIGFDTHPLTEDPQVIRQDIRKAGNLKAKAALVWNDISTWEGSPRSRLAAFKWARRNLKKGGIYIDEGHHKIPADLDLKAFELVHSGQNFTVFRKRV